MGFYNQFKKFNPKSGDTPWHPFSHLPVIASRARALLKARTADQIEDAAYGIDWAIDEYFRSLKDEEITRLKNEVEHTRRWKDGSDDTEFNDAAKFFDWVVDSPESEFSTEEGHWVFNDRMEDELDIQTAGNISEVDALKNCIDWWDDIGGADFPNGKPEELFVILALWLLADTIGWLGHRPSETEKSFLSSLDHLSKLPEGMENELIEAGISIRTTDTEINLSLAGECALKAMDAVCYAEQLHEVAKLEAAYTLKSEKTREENIKKEVEKRSMLAEKLNIARHRKTNEVKEKVVEEWNKNRNQFPSGEQAGLHFADWLESESVYRKQSESNGSVVYEWYTPRTVTTWIREYAKSIGFKFRP